jgi:hypothetical protein
MLGQCRGGVERNGGTKRGIGWTVSLKVVMRCGACFDRAVVTWSGRSIGRAAGIWGSRSSRVGPNIEASLGGIKRDDQSRVDQDL